MYKKGFGLKLTKFRLKNLFKIFLEKFGRDLRALDEVWGVYERFRRGKAVWWMLG